MTTGIVLARAAFRVALRHRSTRQPIRTWSIFNNAEQRQLQRLKEEANLRRHDPEAQASLLRAMNGSGNGNAYEVLRHVDTGQYAVNENVAKEYVKALVATGTIERVKFPLVLDAQALAGAQIGSMNTAAGVAGAAGATGTAQIAAPQTSALAAGAVGSGSKDAPVHVALAEPSTRQQLWRAVRVLGTTFLVLGFIGAIMEERGVTRGMGMTSEVVPEPENADAKTFEDVKGCDEAKSELAEIVEFLRAPEKFTKLGGKLPKGVLLVGPPGTGKTLMARAVAGEADRPFFYASGSEFEEMFVGVGARRVRELFSAAKKHSPCIVFIDEIDAIGGKRNPKDQQYMKMTLNQLLVELDGFNHSEGIIVIAATNFAESLDSALVRPGRFDRHVFVPNPDCAGRRQILEVHTKDIPLGSDVKLEIIARGTSGFSGADLANLANIAALKAASEGLEIVTMEHLEHAKDRIVMGAERKTAISDEVKRLTAYHESGHALVASNTDGSWPIHKATIVPRGQALGMVSQLPEADILSMSRKDILARLDICMGGRAAEELIFGAENVTSGAESDFAQATQLAEAMVTRYGMSEKLGRVAYDKNSESTSTRAAIESEVKKLLDDSYDRAISLLASRKDELHNLARALLHYETLTGDQVQLASKGLLNIEVEPSS